MKTPKRLSPRIMRNLLSTYDAATPAERSAGLEWYANAHAYCVDLARRYGYTVAQVSAVVSALSPGSKWTRNLADAETLLSAVQAGNDVPTLGTYGRKNIDKAIAALALADPETLFSAKTGPKTLAFYRLILDPANVTDAVIDRHAASAALDSRGKLGGSAVDVVRLARYHYLARHYVALAKRVGLLPHQVQAIIWLSWKSQREADDNVVPF